MKKKRRLWFARNPAQNIEPVGARVENKKEHTKKTSPFQHFHRVTLHYFFIVVVLSCLVTWIMFWRGERLPIPAASTSPL